MGWRRTLAVPFRWVWNHPWIVTTAILFACIAFLVRGQDEFCGLAEGIHARNVDQLGQTYDYIGKLHSRDLTLTINRVIIANLSHQEELARFDEAPAMCDHFGLGQPEPDPVIPQRPPKVAKLVHDFQHSAVKTR